MSAHLAQLERAGLLQSWREQHRILYAVDTEGIRQVITFRQYVRHHAMRTLRELRTYRINLALGSSGPIESLSDIAARHFLKRPRQRADLRSPETGNCHAWPHWSKPLDDNS